MVVKPQSQCRCCQQQARCDIKLIYFIENLTRCVVTSELFARVQFEIFHLVYFLVRIDQACYEMAGDLCRITH
jgi:hypothetical protein